MATSLTRLATGTLQTPAHSIAVTRGSAIDRRRFQAAREVFTDALARPPEALTAFARDACDDDEDLLREVLGLLAFHGTESEDADALGATHPWSVPAPVPERIGPYRVLGLVGQGGMGVVYRAQRLDDGDTGPTAHRIWRRNSSTA